MKPSMGQHEFIAFYDQYADPLFRHCYFRVSDRERARDLVQETFTRTWNYLMEGKKVKSPRAFLWRVANNLIIDGYRKAKVLSLDELQAEGFDPPDTPLARIDTAIDASRITRFINELDEKYREVVMLRYLDGLGPKEIAEILGESENAVSVRLHRALKQIADIAAHERL